MLLPSKEDNIAMLLFQYSQACKQPYAQALQLCIQTKKP